MEKGNNSTQLYLLTCLSNPQNKLEASLLNFAFTIEFITSFANTLALIDQNKQLWVYDTLLSKQPINFSYLLHKKIFRVSVGYREIRFITGKSAYLLVWQQQPNPLQKQSQTIFIKKIVGFVNIRCYKLSMSKMKIKYYFPQQYRRNHQVMPYQIQQNFIYRDSQKIITKANIQGMHSSKYHNLCWDKAGKIYSWGKKTIGLGFNCKQSEEERRFGKQIQILSQKYINCAATDQNYSLALSTEGQLYEWGIKNIENEDMIILNPRKLEHKQKFIVVKSRRGLFGSISKDCKLYLWGKNSQKYHESNEKINFPTLLQSMKQKRILDFQILEDFVVVLVQTNNINQLVIKNKYERKNSQNVLAKIKKNFKSYRMGAQNNNQQKFNTQQKRLKTEGPISMNYNKILNDYYQHYECHQKFTKKIDFFQLIKKSKDDRQVIEYIDTKPQICKRNFRIIESSNRENKQNQKQKDIDQNQNKFMQIVSKISKQINSLQNSSLRLTQKSLNYLKQKSKLKNQSQIKITPILKRSQTSIKKQFFSERFNIKVKQVIDKKQNLFRSKRKQIIEQLEKNNEDNKNKIKQLKLQQEIKQKKSEFLRNLRSIIFKQYTVQIIQRPIQKLHLCLLKRMSLTFNLQRKIRSIQRAFLRRQLLKKISILSIRQIILLKKYIKSFVEKFRQKKIKKSVMLIVQRSIQYRLQQNIQYVIMIFVLTIKKISKLNWWYKKVRENKLKALRYKWNLILINSLHFKYLSPELSQFKSKQYQQIKTSTIYRQICHQKPWLNLRVFLNDHPIFRINFKYIQKVSNIQKKNQKPKPVVKKVRSVKFALIEQKQHRFDILDKQLILPYSNQYDNAVLPANYAIRLPHYIYKNEKWQEKQRKTLNKILLEQLKRADSHFFQELDKYDKKMAIFIRDNYQQLKKKRFKYIITYNSLQNTIHKQRIYKQLIRILAKQNLTQLLKDDYIPEKYCILEDARMMPGAPPYPINMETINKATFKNMFNKYKQQIQNCANQIISRS